ncbi:MAG: ABC transporter ATP-binding protein [Clostridia bacterium]|nr:ABC transporter ATP-binding protein [Clostridia bacterium]
MSEKRPLSEMPESLKQLVDTKKLLGSKLLVFAEADMNTNCEFCRFVLLLTKTALIVGTNNKLGFADPNKKETDFSEFSFTSYSIKDLNNPKITTFVVGGMLSAEIDGEQTPICAFTNAYKGRVMRVCEILNALIKNEEIKEERLFEEKHDEFCHKCGMPYPEKNRKICPKCMDKRKIFFRLASCFKPFKIELAVICVICILSALVNSVWPILNGSLLYDTVLAKNKANSVFEALPFEDFAVFLLILVLMMVGVKILQQLFGIIQGVLVAKIVPKVVADLKNKVFASIQHLSVSFFTGKETGGLMSRITSDAANVTNIFIDGLPFILPNLFTIIFSCVVMFSTSPLLAAVAIATLPPAIIISIKLEPVLWHYNSRRFQTARDFRAKLNDNLTGARVVRAFGREESERVRLQKVNGNVAAAQSDAMNFDVKYTALYHIAQSLSSVLTFTVGAAFVLAVFKPQMTYGTLMTFTGYVSLLSGPANFFSFIFRWWSDSMNSAQRIFEILDAKPEVTEDPNAEPKTEIKGDITLKDVTFGYEENREVLKNVSLSVNAGEMLGIVGKSGAGKTTLVNLITRLYDVNEGEILIDGVNVRDMRFCDLRKNIALVSQETYIFKGTIFENIAYANPSADRKAVIDAAIAASAHDFICKLPDGYDTQVGSGGRGLSGGERQRISIARAILADPKILILDEATAAVDTETEKNIQASLKKLVKNRTTLSIAHRLSTLRDADKLVVIDGGKIVEEGTHKQLMLQKGEYFKLFQIQSKALAMRGIGD